MRQRRCARQRKAGDYGENRRERHSRDEAEERLPSKKLGEHRRRHVPAFVYCSDSVGPYEHHCAKPEDEREQVEEADEARRVEHRFARRLRIGDRVEPHENVGQPRGAEDERDAERDRVERVRYQLATGASIASPNLSLAAAKSASGFMLKRARTMKASNAAPQSSSAAFTICTQVVASIPPNSTYATIAAPTIATAVL